MRGNPYAERAKANTLSTNEFIDSLPLPCCIFNTDLELTDFSKSAALLFEASSDEMLGKSPDLWQAVNIGDKKHFSGLLLQVFSGAEPRLVHEFTHKLPSGDVILCEWNFSQYQPTDAKPWVIALIKPLNTSNNRLATQEGSGWSLRSLLGLASLKSELGKRSEKLRQLNLILQEKDKRLMTILHNIPVGICVASTGSFTGEMNPAYLNLFGYSAEELRTMSLESITHPDDLQWNTRVISEVMEGRSDRADYEKRYIRKDGGIVWVKVTMVPLKDAEGRTYNVIAVAQDITAQKQAEQFMAQQQELIRMGGKAARMGYWMRDPGVDSATFWSDELFEFYECDDKVVLPIDKVFAMHLPGYRSLAQTQFEQLTLEGKRMEYECELITLKGSHKWLRVVGDVIWSSSGKIAKIIGAIQDIGERKQQQLESLRLNDRISSTMDTMSEAFMIIDRNWESIFMNKAAETLLKTRRDVLHNGSLWDQQPWMKTSVLYEGYHQAMNGKQPFNAEYFSPRLNDWMETWAYPCDEGIAVYYHSISDKKRLLAQVQASEQKLKYVAKATLDVMWERNLADNSIQWDSGLRKWGYPGNTDDGKSLTASGFWLQRIHAQEQDAVISSLDSVLKSRHDHWEATYRFRKADGSYIHVMDRGVVFRDKELQPVKMIGGMTDISERIRLEEHFQQAQRIDSIGKLTGG
ncbi:MAG: PAS domain-containing protein, partial [Gammaproteobacteria bacterium]